MNHTANYRNLRYVGAVVAVIGGLAAYNQQDIRDLFQPRAPVPPVTQVYNNNSCLDYNGKTYVLHKERAMEGDGINKLLLRHNPQWSSTLEGALKEANRIKNIKFIKNNGLKKGSRYLTPAPDYENKCK